MEILNFSIVSILAVCLFLVYNCFILLDKFHKIPEPIVKVKQTNFGKIFNFSKNIFYTFLVILGIILIIVVLIYIMIKLEILSKTFVKNNIKIMFFSFQKRIKEMLLLNEKW